MKEVELKNSLQLGLLGVVIFVSVDTETGPTIDLIELVAKHHDIYNHYDDNDDYENSIDNIDSGLRNHFLRFQLEKVSIFRALHFHFIHFTAR